MKIAVWPLVKEPDIEKVETPAVPPIADTPDNEDMVPWLLRFFTIALATFSGDGTVISLVWTVVEIDEPVPVVGREIEKENYNSFRLLKSGTDLAKNIY